MNPALIANQNHSLSETANSEALWEIHNQDFLSGTRKLDMQDYNILKKCLTTVENSDSYALSPAYYLMTCRKGLWLYGSDEQFLLFGWHPNVTGQMVIFNPRQQATSALLEICLHDMPPPPAGSIVGRMQETILACAKPIQEEILDWVYPIQTLSTTLVTQHKGTCFRDLRKNLYRVNEELIDVKSVNEQSVFIDALRLINGWSSIRESENYKLEDLSDPQVYMLKLLKVRPDALEGFALYHNHAIAGLCIWEKSCRDTVNSFVSVSRPDIRGLSDYIIYQMCRQLHAQHISKVCIGGSESAGLDAFKRKFNPVHSQPLQSFQVLKKTIPAYKIA